MILFFSGVLLLLRHLVSTWTSFLFSADWFFSVTQQICQCSITSSALRPIDEAIFMPPPTADILLFMYPLFKFNDLTTIEENNTSVETESKDRFSRWRRIRRAPSQLNVREVISILVLLQCCFCSSSSNQCNCLLTHTRVLEWMVKGFL